MAVSQRTIRRRRVTALGIIAVVSAAGGAAVGVGAGDGGGPGPSLRSAAATSARPPAAPPPAADTSSASGDASAPPRTAPRPARATPAPSSRPGASSSVRAAGRTLIIRFAGTAAPQYVRRALREGRAAGVILFRDNVVSPRQLRRMTGALQRAARGRALIMTDQEGGVVRRIPWAGPAVGQPRLTSTAAAEAAARAAGRDLRELGVNVTLAPVADVGSWPRSVMRSRAFPGDGAAVGRLVAASIRGYRSTGVAPTAKHFPGLGRSRTNTDFAPASVPGSGDVGPFAEAIRAGVPLVMSDHAVHAGLDPERIASQSRRVVHDLLRTTLGFRGVVVTDSLEAQAVVRRSTTPVAAERSMRAGNDLLLTTGRGSFLPVLRHIAAAARRSRAFRDRLREAGDRVDALGDDLARGRRRGGAG